MMADAGGAEASKMQAECHSLSDSVLSLDPRAFTAWTDLAKSQFDQSDAMSTVKILQDYPAPVVEGEPDLNDGKVRTHRMASGYSLL